MILKSYLVEKDITLLDKYFITLIYGENIGMKDDIKNEIKKFFNDYEKITFTQDEILKDYRILNEQVDNTSLFSQKKIIFISEISDKIKDLISEILENRKSDIKIFLFAQNLDRKSAVRRNFEKNKEVGIIACYQDNERTLSDYVRKNLEGYRGLSQQMINFLISNSGLNRKTLFHEIKKIKSLFSDKNIDIKKLPELLNNNNNLDFDDLRDYCLSAEKEKLNYSLGSVAFQNENAYFYLGILGARIEKLLNLNYLLKKEKNLDKAIDTIKPPIFWKDKPIFYKQMKKWNIKKLKEAKGTLFKTELKIKKNANLNNNVLLKNLIINLYEKAESTS
ncbi:DNA polymerase III subunit delta [Pelagibacteraceae bacterium]|nr:DNA polymerase III subunit delta [Pelagibacteraceae bacterium]